MSGRAECREWGPDLRLDLGGVEHQSISETSAASPGNNARMSAYVTPPAIGTGWHHPPHPRRAHRTSIQPRLELAGMLCLTAPAAFINGAALAGRSGPFPSEPREIALEVI